MAYGSKEQLLNTPKTQHCLRLSSKTSLDEAQAKKLLAQYQVPCVNEMVATTLAEVISIAGKMDFPLVLKGLGSALSHKTERGLVHLGLASLTQVEEAARAIHSAAGKHLDGFLIQPQLQGRREFVAGLFRDPQFGAVILFGLGGILTEALSDVSLRLAPLTLGDAEQMITEIKAQSLLGSFRGEKAVDRKAIVDTLLGLSKLSQQRPDIAEIDINPLLVTSDGRMQAVDALVVSETTRSPIDIIRPVPPKAIGSLFYPASIAFIGASEKIGKWGHMLPTNTIAGGYDGEIYLVNSKGAKIAGRTVYRCVGDITGPVDLAVVTVPAASVPELIPQLQAKGIKNMLLISSGFAETGSQGKLLEEELICQAATAGILILGPNTMGICNPHINLYCCGVAVRPRPGSTAMVSQSGNMGTQLLAFAEEQGIGIRGFAGSGNEAMLRMEDYLDGFAKDETTRTVMLYIESVKNGRRFFESARVLSRRKPIILLKGGQTGAGLRAAASHTGAMTSDARVFNAACRQAGIIKVERSMDLLDLAAAFSSMPLPAGNRAAIMTLGGGWGVVTADLCDRYGLCVPQLSEKLIKRIDQLLPAYWSRSNPIDLVGDRDLDLPLTILEALMQWEGCDAVINLGILGRRIFTRRMAEAIRKADPSYSPDSLEAAVSLYADLEQRFVEKIVQLMESYGKPVYGVSLVKDRSDQTVYRVNASRLKAVIYETPERAVHAFARMVEYSRFREHGQ
jgi:acyl-CoA synthetase (NDP forming)